MKTKALILAAGLGTRMKSELPKVMHKICGEPMLYHVIDNLKKAGIDEIAAVVGYKKEMVKDYFGEDICYFLQDEQLGTGHAVMMAKDFFNDQSQVIITCGDAPVISSEEIVQFLKYKKENKYKACIITTELENPYGYGRIQRSDGKVTAIIEQKDCTQKQVSMKEVNSGTYCINSEYLLNALDKLNTKNAQGEYYLTDVISILNDEDIDVGGYITEDANIIKAVNNRVQLAEIEKIMRKKINEYHMLNGVTILDPTNTYIEKGCTIGMDSIIHPNSFILQGSIIGNGCEIISSRVQNSKIEDGVVINNSTIVDSSIGQASKVGPYAYLRPNSKLGKNVKIGDFVEVKNSTIGNNSKASHLTYIGDADVGENVNLGCGIVFVNYDGKKKHRTIIEDDCFIGCNVNLIAPVKIGKGSYAAAGSTVTDDVPQNSLVIARSRQTVKKGWIQK